MEYTNETDQDIYFPTVPDPAVDDEGSPIGGALVVRPGETVEIPDPVPLEPDLELMKKADLLDLARDQGVQVAGNASKASIIAALQNNSNAGDGSTTEVAQ